MARGPESTAAWVAGRVRKLDDVTAVDVLSPNSLRISRNDYPPFVAGVLSEAVVTKAHVEGVLSVAADAEIVVNIPVESKWTGSAIEAARGSRVAWGGLRDLMSVARRDDVRGYERGEYQFAERLLGQFGIVERIEREADRLWILHRKQGLLPLRVIVLSDYELTGDSVRTARDRYGAFDVVFLNNPNGKPTAQAQAVANALGVPILMAGELKGRLSRP